MLLVVSMIFFSISQARLAEAAGGTVTVDQSQYVIPYIGQSAMVNISGSVSSPSGGFVVLTLTHPDGTLETIHADITGEGVFTTPYLLDSSSEVGQYGITASYQGINFGSVTFNVVSQSTSTNNPVQSPQTPPVTTSSTGTPAITSVSNIIPNPNQAITISGSGFGTTTPYNNGDSQYIQITDNTGNWNAGYHENLVTLNVASWSDNQISISGFSGSYGSGSWTLHYGDTIYVYVWNPQTGKGPATYTTTVGMDTTTTPTVNLSPSTVNGMAATINGNWNFPNRVSKVTVDWGDNSGIVTINSQSQYTHTYSQYGTYTETLTVYDINGLSGSATTTINLQQPPTPTAPTTAQLGSQQNPYPVYAGWQGPGYYNFVAINHETGYMNTVCDLNAVSVQISGNSLSSPYDQNQIAACNGQTTPSTSQNQNPTIQNTQLAEPPYVFNGAYANYQIIYTVAGNSVSIPLSYIINSVDNSSQTFTFAANYGGSLSVLSMTSLTGTFGNPSLFPAVNAEDLSILNQGNVPSDMQGATVTKDVSISVPAGTFNTDEITSNGASKWVDTSSGLVIQQSGSFLGASMPSLMSSSMQLAKTNIPTNSSPIGGSMIYLIIIPIVAAGGAFFVIKKRKGKAKMQPEVKESKKPEKIKEPTPEKENRPEPEKIAKESPKTNFANLEKIEKLKKLLDAGLITQEDFDEKKQKLLD